MVAAQPVEQLAGLVGLAPGPAERLGLDLGPELGGDGDGPFGHRVPVGHRDPDEVEHLVRRRAPGPPPRPPPARAGPGQQLEVHPRLVQRVGLLGRLRRPQQPLEPALRVAQHEELRVEHLADGPALAQDLHRHRVDEEGQVVGHHLEHRRPAQPTGRRGVRPVRTVEVGPAVQHVGAARADDADHVLAGLAHQRRAVVVLDELEELGDRTVLEVGRVDVAEVVPHEGRDRFRVLPELARDPTPGGGDRGDLVGLVLLEPDLVRRHVTIRLCRRRTSSCVTTTLDGARRAG